MDASPRQRLEQHLGRPVTDDEWETFERFQLSTATGGGPAESGGAVAGAARSIAALLGALILAFLVGVAVTIVVIAMVLGLLWAYSPGTLDRTGDGDTGAWDVIGSVCAVVFFGFLVMTYWRVVAVVLGIGLSVGLVALAVGAVIRVVGG